MKNKIFILLVLLLATLSAYFATLTKSPEKVIFHSTDKWDEQLNSMIYLVIRASSINLINGLYLSKEQITELQKLAIQVDALQNQMPDNKVHYNSEFEKIGETYKSLIRKLINKAQLDDTLKNKVYNALQAEVDIIKRSLLAANQIGYKGENCRECHAPPALFLKGNISDKSTLPTTASDRNKIDLVHLKGLFGDTVMMLLWNLRDKVDSILNKEQKYILGSFRCCLIPLENIADSINFELKKENLSGRLSDSLNINLFNGETSRMADERKFMATMFLLLPGSSSLYNQLLPQPENK